ncbi:hypothetical protein GCM10027170_37720 [Aliiglaciecola aliphaticivorans]
MAIKNEISILTRAEQADLYSPPIFSIEEQRLYFTLNEAELAVSDPFASEPIDVILSRFWDTSNQSQSSLISPTRRLQTI